MRLLSNRSFIFCKLGLLVFLVLTHTCLIGCGRAGPNRLPIHGIVLLDGMPISDSAIIMTSDTSGGLVASASIVDGQFHFSTKDGPTQGRYKVRINPNAPELEQAAANPSLLRVQRKPRIPKEYQSDNKLLIEAKANLMEPLKIELFTNPRR